MRVFGGEMLRPFYTGLLVLLTVVKSPQLQVSMTWDTPSQSEWQNKGLYSFYHNHGSGKWLYLKSNYYWRDPFLMGGSDPGSRSLQDQFLGATWSFPRVFFGNPPPGFSNEKQSFLCVWGVFIKKSVGRAFASIFPG